MSLTAKMHSWCHNYKNMRSDRSAFVGKVAKHSHHVVKSHNAYRSKMSNEIREKLKFKYSANKKRVYDMMRRYINDRNEAYEILAAMRSGREENLHKETKNGR